MEFKEKVFKLEEKGFNWFEIAELLDSDYNSVRMASEDEDL